MKTIWYFLCAVIFLAIVTLGLGSLAKIFPPNGWKCYTVDGKEYCDRFDSDGSVKPD